MVPISVMFTYLNKYVSGNDMLVKLSCLVIQSELLKKNRVYL